MSAGLRRAVRAPTAARAAQRRAPRAPRGTSARPGRRGSARRAPARAAGRRPPARHRSRSRRSRSSAARSRPPLLPMAAQAQRVRVEAVLGEEVEEVLGPAPGPVARAMHEQQRRAVRLAIQRTPVRGDLQVVCHERRVYPGWRAARVRGQDPAPRPASRFIVKRRCIYSPAASPAAVREEQR